MFLPNCTSACKIDKYLKSIGDSVVIFDGIIGVTKTIPTKTISKNYNEKKVMCKIENFYISLSFLLITESLLIIVNLLLSLKTLIKIKTLIKNNTKNILIYDVGYMMVKDLSLSVKPCYQQMKWVY